MNTLDAKSPRILLREEEAALWAQIAQRFAQCGLSKEQMDTIHKDALNKLVGEGKLIIV